MKVRSQCLRGSKAELSLNVAGMVLLSLLRLNSKVHT